MRCVSADGKPSVIGLVFRLAKPTSGQHFLAWLFSLRAPRLEGSADTFAGRAGDPGLNPFGKSSSTGFV